MKARKLVDRNLCAPVCTCRGAFRYKYFSQLNVKTAEIATCYQLHVYLLYYNLALCFLTRDAMLERYMLWPVPCVCPSVTSRCSIKTARHITPHNSMTKITINPMWSPDGAPNTDWVGRNQRFSTISRYTSETVKDRTNKKLSYRRGTARQTTCMLVNSC